MKRTNLFLIALLSLVLSLSSCLKSNDTGDVPPGLFFSQVSASPVSDNALREEVTVDMVQAATVWIEYWQKGGDTVLVSQEITNHMQPKFTLLFMEEDSQYEFVIKAIAGDQRTTSNVYSFKTRTLPGNFETYTMHESDYKFKGYMFVTQRFAPPGNLILLNNKGKVVWYQALAPNLGATNYDTVTQTFTCTIGGGMDNVFVCDEIATIDLYGKITFRKSKPEIGNKLFHHDVRLLPNGNYIAINFVKKAFDLTKWGGSTEEVVTGDGYTIFDNTGKILSTWDCFGTLNPQDDPNVMQEFPMFGPGFRLKDDWLHANAVDICPDGNYIMSMNMKSQIWKINAKTGETMWRLGQDGDVTAPKEMIQNMQHSCNIAPDGDLVFYDNNGGADQCSRIIKAKVDDATKSAVPDFIVTLPKTSSSSNQSSAYMIDKDHAMFGSTMSSTVGIVDRTGKMKWRVVASHQFFRAQYIDGIKLK